MARSIWRMSHASRLQSTPRNWKIDAGFFVLFLYRGRRRRRDCGRYDVCLLLRFAPKVVEDCVRTMTAGVPYHSWGGEMQTSRNYYKRNSTATFQMILEYNNRYIIYIEIICIIIDDMATEITCTVTRTNDGRLFGSCRCGR
jgi:hypothetical protein